MNRGFTLIELGVVSLLLGVLVAVSVPQYLKSVEVTRFQAAAAKVKVIGRANQMFANAHRGFYAFGAFTGTSCLPGVCPTDVTMVQPACALVWCKYIPDENWDASTYEFSACDGNTNSACVEISDLQPQIANAIRKLHGQGGTQQSPYMNWRFSMGLDGTLKAQGPDMMKLDLQN